MLDAWYGRRNDRDLVIKMNTGSGKTLAGLMILWSRLQEKSGPAVYLCPDLYLVSQVKQEATALGIATVEFGSDNRFPLNFLNGSAILVTTIQKVINGRTVFGLVDNPDYIRVGTLLVDDAHTCIKVGREHFAATFQRDSPVGKTLYNRFSDSLKSQSVGAWADLEQGKFHANMRVPYWTWIDQIDQTASLLSEHQDDNELIFIWPFLKHGEVLKNCACVISGESLEITPLVLPINLVPSFDKANHRIYMSATLVDDAALIRDFRATSQSVLKPIRPKIKGDIGERLVISPSLVDTKIDDQTNMNLVKEIRNKFDLNVCVLVPSRREANRWKGQRATEATRDDIGQVISSLSEKSGQLIVFVNRYDGIDLPDDVCRLLVMDGLPGEWGLFKLNEAASRTESPIIRREQAKKIEQGLGRGVRSQSDHCVVVLMRSNLIAFMSKVENQNYFTPETRAQVELGLYLAGVLQEQKSNSYQAILGLVDQCLSRDASWQEYHRSRVQSASDNKVSQDAVELATSEAESWESAMRSQYDLASNKIAALIEKHCSSVEADRGWYLQLQATYLLHVNRPEAFEKQLKAHELNTSLLKPPAGVRYKRLVEKQTYQASNIRDWIRLFNEPNGLVADANRVLDVLMFDMPAQEFEAAFGDLASILGFQGHRPEHEFGKGPDVVWRMSDGHYLVVEAKNQTLLTRKKIYKSDAEQIANSNLWFEQEYPETPGTPILIHPANMLASDAFVPNGCKVIQADHLQSLVSHTRSFVSALSSKPLNQWTVEQIAAQINANKLTPGQIRNENLGTIRAS